jgi:ligand-binding SRPBCC domain-containing protein
MVGDNREGLPDKERQVHFVKESHISASPEAVFSFHESPGALERLIPPWEKVRVIRGGESIRPGSRVTLRTYLGPIPIQWVAEHTEYDPPHLFADRQVSGPFASWYHRHRILDDGRGGSILRDEIEYELPWGALGRLFGAGMVLRKLVGMFDYRHEITRSILAGRSVPDSGGS